MKTLFLGLAVFSLTLFPLNGLWFEEAKYKEAAEAFFEKNPCRDAYFVYNALYQTLQCNIALIQDTLQKK